ncbi:MAG TPA: AAA family ATPase [Azospirillaceae bacterium]|nr:AAA family ATPase [Azospirillaceae bacterium]
MTHMQSAKPYRIGAVLRTAELHQAVAAALALEPGLAGVLQRGTLANLGTRALEAMGADLLLLDADLDDAADMAVLARLIEEVAHSFPIVVTAKDPTVDGSRRLMRLGIMDLIPQPIIANDLVAAIAAARHRVGSASSGGSRSRRGRVVSFLKACGGAGATALAVHAASQLARQPGGAERVGLLDLDLQFGTVALYLDLGVTTGVLELIQTPDRLDGSLLRGLMTADGKGLDVLASPEPVVPLELMSADLASRLVEVASAEYDHVLVDLPHAWSIWTRSILEASDAIVLVTPMSVPGIRQCRRQIATLEAEGLGSVPLLVVANRHERGLFGKSSRQREAERALGREISLFVPDDARAMAVAIDAGSTLLDTHEGAKVLKAVSALVDALPATSGSERGEAD